VFGCRRVAFAICLLTVGVSACTVIDRTDPRHDTINRAAGNARNESILLNIVRASQNVPLNFVAFSRVSGSQTAQASTGLPAFGVGPAPLVAAVQRQTVFGSAVLNANTSVNNSFDIGILESKDFYNGLLTPVDLATLNFFNRQGYNRQLLMWLFFESVRETMNGRTYEYRNEPVMANSCDPAFPGEKRCFRDIIDVALASGLTAQTETITRISTQGRVNTTVYGRMCFDDVLARTARYEYSDAIRSHLTLASGHRPRCSDRWMQQEHGIVLPAGGKGKGQKGTSNEMVVEGSPDTVTFEFVGGPSGRVKYSIVTRSTFGIYQFLGGLLRNRHGTVMLRGRAARGEPEFIPLLEIIRDSSTDCFIDLRIDENHYCVPRDGAETTKSIFGLLAQLIALRTQTGDLAITPAVRVSP
jgi:hypothetical protein